MRERGVLIGLVSIIILCGVVLYLKDPSPMNFIETYFGFSPDNGDGSLEIWLIVVLAIFVGAISLSLRSPDVMKRGQSPTQKLKK
jgi:hypothetical protein